MNQNTFCKYCHRIPSQCCCTSAKTLTDEEILNIAFCSEIDTVSIQNDWDGTVIEFARAILRKAQEK